MITVKKSRRGIDYLGAVLREKKTVITRAIFWRVAHTSGIDHINLKIGRYLKVGFDEETLEAKTPKSELTLDDEELTNLLNFVADNYAPLRSGESKYLPLDDQFDQHKIEQLKGFFQNPDKQELLRLITENSILPEDLMLDVQHHRRVTAIQEFENLMAVDANEHKWQSWFSQNDWVLGSDFVRVLDERIIDPDNVADYLVQAYDGFLDIIEIKRPGGGLRFWTGSRDHGNVVPSTDLIKAITQATGYIYEVEREINSQKFMERIGDVRTVKPRCILVFGRSDDWDEDQRRAYRILNSSYHNLSIMTYDHVLTRAKRMLGIPSENVEEQAASTMDDEIPF
ncbi:MAG: DUF4263 domain-containing protein [Hyphomicrobiaceae bacterium]|nr:DUF4263 domain-containing protein [Hyphomicrobiaceae bacterium]